MNREKCEVWEPMLDGSSNHRGTGFGMVLKSSKASNNEAKYEALINSWKMSLAIGISGIKVLTDSKLVAQQLNGGYETREERMVQYVKASCNLISNFESFEMVQVPRKKTTMLMPWVIWFWTLEQS